MIRFPHLKAIAAAAATCGAMLVGGPAHAYVYATSALNVANLSLITTSGSATVTGFAFRLDNSATLSGAAVASSAQCSGTIASNNCSTTSPVLDATVVNGTGSSPLRTENNFAFLGTAPTTSYSNADSVIGTAALVQGVPTSSRQVSESLLNTNGSAGSVTNVQSLTNLTFSVVVGSGGANLSFSFDADPDQRVEVNGLPGFYTAQSNLTASFTLTNLAGEAVSWSPQGTAASVCDSDIAGVTCTETADSADLNRNVAAPNANPITVSNSFEVADLLVAFGINILGLPEGAYSLALSSTTSTDVTRNVVPEPGTTGLIGLALAGLALVARRSKGLIKK